MKKQYLLKNRITFCILIMTFSVNGFGALVKQLGTKDLAEQSLFIFHGTVIEKQSYFGSNNNIFTDISFDVEEVNKGDALAEITLTFMGGEVNGIGMSIDANIPDIYETGIFFVESPNNIDNPILGWSQGVFLIEANGQIRAGNGEIIIGLEEKKLTELIILNGDSGIAEGVLTASDENNLTTTPISIQELKDFLAELLGE